MHTAITQATAAHPCFKRTPLRIEPLNVETLLDKIRLVLPPQQQQQKWKSTLLFRSVHNRILFFDRDQLEQSAEKRMKNKNINNNAAPPQPRYALALPRGSRFGFSNFSSSQSNEQDDDVAVPFASLQPPPLLPFPVRELQLWTGEEDERNVAAATASGSFYTLEDYVKRIEEARSVADRMSSAGGCDSTTASTQSDWWRNSVGVLSAAQNQLSFVVADCNRNVLLGPITAMRLESLVGGPSSESERHYFSSFWKQICSELTKQVDEMSQNSQQQQLSALWLKTQGSIAVDLYENCCCFDNKQQHEEFALKLRDADPRWMRLPGTVAKGKKALVDNDSMLRDLYYGTLQLCRE